MPVVDKAIEWQQDCDGLLCLLYTVYTRSKEERGLARLHSSLFLHKCEHLTFEIIFMNLFSVFFVDDI